MPKGIIEDRGAIRMHKTATVAKAWDGPANEARLKSDQPATYYFRAFAWQDSDANPKVKASYKFVHHEVSADGTPGAANVRGLISGIGVLNGARGGTKIPEADRRGVYNHLARHLKDAGRDAPPLRSDISSFERRVCHSGEIRVADADGDSLPKIEGHAAVFNKLSVRMFGFKEKIAPGAFKKTIKEADVRALFNHDPNFVLGRNKAGTLKLKEDDKGLFYSVQPPDTQGAKDLIESIKRGDVSQSSFGFKVVKDLWTHDDDGGELIRELVEVRLFDVSPVTFPAYEATDTQVRSLAAYAGIDGEQLNNAVRKALMGDELKSEERGVIAASIDFLRRCASEEPIQEDHSTEKEPEQRPHSLSTLRKKLDLLELE